MKVVLVDDEPAMLLAMKMLLSKIDGVELVGCFQNSSEVLDFIGDNDVDLAFLDIRLATENGLELARSLRAAYAGLDIVFTTSHTEFAMQAYDVYPLDYMVKPVSRQRLVQTIARAVAKRNSAGSSIDASADASLSIPNRLYVQGFGCFEASSKQAGAVKWISRKSMELFAYLLTHRGQSVSRSRVLEDVFHNMPPKNAEKYLHTAIYQLRKVLAGHGFKEIIFTTQEKYRVDMNQVDVDFIAFEQGLEHLGEIDAATEATAVNLEKQFAGELFADNLFAWATVERERSAIMYDSLAKRLAGWLLAQCRYKDAVHIAAKIVARNEFEEESNALLLSIYAAMGDRRAFLNHYSRYKQLLAVELGLQASPTIDRLYDQHYGQE